jgi:hypothetical protein
MNSCRTLTEFKKRIKEEELQAGEKNVHGRRFVNWLIQGGCKRRYKTGLYGGYTKRARLHGGAESDNSETENGGGASKASYPEIGSIEWYQLKAQHKVEGKLIPLNTYF